MQVFISWSGAKSGEVAVVLRDWLPGVIQVLEPFVSAKDIDAGSRWQAELAAKLDTTNFGIVCVTRENQLEPWLNFEAGALAKSVEQGRLVPLAIDLKPSDVKNPLGQFQAQPATEDGMREVVRSLNSTSSALTDDRLERAFELNWPSLEKSLAVIAGEDAADPPPIRSERELLEETLDTVRSLGRLITRRFDEPQAPTLEGALASAAGGESAVALVASRLRTVLDESNVDARVRRVGAANVLVTAEQPVPTELQQVGRVLGARWGVRVDFLTREELAALTATVPESADEPKE